MENTRDIWLLIGLCPENYWFDENLCLPAGGATALRLQDVAVY